MTRYAFAVWLLAAASLVGCDQQTIVTGKVTYNGEPVEKGQISFRPAGPTGQSFGAPIKDGVFEADKAQPGTWTAMIIGVKKVDFAMSSEEAAKRAAQSKSNGHLAGHVSDAADYIPETAEGNGRTVEISAGKQTIDFEVKGPPRS